jgi:hypothetical protein
MPMGHRLENLFRDELAEFNLPLLVTGGTQAAALARETNPYKLHPLLTR